MRVEIFKTSQELGKASAAKCASIINKAIEKKGFARVAFPTGQSQLETYEALLKLPVDWKRVELFHLDEYMGIGIEHPASFRKYMMDRFISKVTLMDYHLINVDAHLEEELQKLNTEIKKAPLDLGLIGIGENGHIAFNDPPADFDTQEGYIIVNLDTACKKQQVGEGWFPTLADVPDKAVSITVYQIMQCENLVCGVPHAVKAAAVKNALTSQVSNLVPASIIKTHPNIDLLLDENSSSLLDKETIERYTAGR